LYFEEFGKKGPRFHFWGAVDGLDSALFASLISTAEANEAKLEGNCKNKQKLIFATLNLSKTVQLTFLLLMYFCCTLYLSQTQIAHFIYSSDWR